MRRFYRRSFLNRRGHHAGAYVIADVRLEHDPHSQRSWVLADLTIADCNRVAVLDFGVDEGKDAANALHKARLLRDVVTVFTDALEAAVEEYGAQGTRTNASAR
jgi:hypothetical protein